MDLNFRWPKRNPCASIPAVLRNESLTLSPDHDGSQIVHDSTAAHTFTLDGGAVAALPVGWTVTINNDAGAGIITVTAINGYTLIWANDGTTANRSIAANGVFTITHYKQGKFKGTGANVT